MSVLIPSSDESGGPFSNSLLVANEMSREPNPTQILPGVFGSKFIPDFSLIPPPPPMSKDEFLVVHKAESLFVL